MAYLSYTEQRLKLHEFFDKLKADALKHIADGGEFMQDTDGDKVVLKFWKKPEPPKCYTFTQAYEMMKQGRWMRYKGHEVIARCVNGSWEQKNIESGGHVMGHEYPLWEEVQP